MGYNFFYVVGILLLFLGLFWSFLPHVYHEKINLNKNNENSLDEEQDHVVHILIGIPPTVLGILMIEYSNRKKKSLNSPWHKRNKTISF
ncbi:MAG: hypothetical protein AABX77_01695 [Nanoarchaeota archaeon]